MTSQIHLFPDDVTFESLPGRTILESAEQAGITMAFGCRAGACGACYVHVLEGLDKLPAPTAIESDTLRKIKREGQGRLACRVKNSSSDVTIQRR